MIRTPKSRAGCTALSTSGRGAWSPPIASRAMGIIQAPVGKPRKDHGRRGSGPGVHNFPAFIVTTLRASLVRLFHFVTVRALSEGRSFQKIMSAPLVLPRV